ncbi:MAG: NAD-dependent epimerase/dehydratase family protein [Bradymonadaceae bacterium]
MTASKSSRRSTHRDRVVVTGAAGGVGRQIVMALLDAGKRVRAVDRHALAAAFLPEDYAEHDGLEWLERDLLDADALDGLLSDTGALVHAAALVGLSETDEELREPNVELVRRLFEEATKEKVDHFIHLSCASFYSGEGGVRTEDSPVDPCNAYERTKVASEAILSTSSGSPTNRGPSWTILRLALVYGPGCTTMAAGMVTLPPILRDALRYLPGLSGGPRTNWCHAEDAARAVITVLGNPEAYGRIFNVADCTALSFGEVLTSIADAYDMELGPSLPFPNAAIWAVLSPMIDHEWAFDVSRRALRHRWRRIQQSYGLSSPLRPKVDRSALFYVRNDAIVVASALEELGWVPRWRDFRRGIVDTIRWYQEMGWVPKMNWSSQVNMEKERRGFGLQYVEHFQGPLILDAADALPLELDLTIEWHRIPRPLGSTEGYINGSIRLDDDAPRAIRGTIQLSFGPVPTLIYEFGFDDGEGEAFRFRGTRALRGPNAVERWLTLEGCIVDKRAREIGCVRLRFQKLEGIAPLPSIIVAAS